MNAQELVIVESSEVKCEGGSGALGHPLVYLNMGSKTDIICPYCGKKFFRKTSGGKKTASE
jgi:uncharacterized Zn-finger protein